MGSSKRPSGQATVVVLALAEQPATWQDAYQLRQQLDLNAGTLYPTLMRLADRGLLATTWEPDIPAGRPPRHRYRLTGPGRLLAADPAAEPTAPAKVARAVGPLGRRPRPEGT